MGVGAVLTPTVDILIFDVFVVSVVKFTVSVVTVVVAVVVFVDIFSVLLLILAVEPFVNEIFRTVVTCFVDDVTFSVA